MSYKWASPETFKELTARAHDMKVIIANCHDSFFGFAKLKKDKVEFVNFSKNATKEMMSISKAKSV